MTRTTGAVPVDDAVAARRGGDELVPAPRPAPAPLSARDKVLAYVALTKPRIIELLLVTTVPSMIVAARGLPPLDLVLTTLLGGALSAGGANAINCYVDRDIDEIMARTRKRPLPRHVVEPRNALWFGVALGAVAFALLWAAVNLLSAVLTTCALLFYVLVYTLLLKRTTPQNIVIGGAAGAVPVLVGWSAVTGTVELPALALFAIVFYWTPPHFWALSMRYEREYRAAGVPMMPVVYGKEETAKHVLLYTLLLSAMTLAFFSVGRMGLLFLASAVVLDASFLVWAVRLYRRPEPRIAWGMFRFSIYYLALLFGAAALDQLVAAA
ncbi:MAG TPA: heme o synthase [Actinomycetota bacterium]|nr:heme o synthase [Actinomycetota bacterium]